METTSNELTKKEQFLKLSFTFTVVVSSLIFYDKYINKTIKDGDMPNKKKLKKPLFFKSS